MGKNNKIVAPNDGKPMFAIMLTLLLLISVVTIGLIVFPHKVTNARENECRNGNHNDPENRCEHP